MDDTPILRGMDEDYGLAQRIALIRYYFKQTPETIKEFSQMWNSLTFALKFDSKMRTYEPKKG